MTTPTTIPLTQMSDLSPAELLRQRHAAVSAAAEPTLTVSEGSLSKESSPVPEIAPAAPVKSVAGPSAASKRKGLDINSLEAFPALNGGAPAPKAVWGKGGSAPAAPSPQSFGRAASTTISDVFTLKREEQQVGVRSELPKIIAKVKANTSTTIDSSTSKITGHTSFVIKGTPENVAKARRELHRALSQKIVAKFEIPASVRAAVIGPRGSNLKPILEKSGAHIQIEKLESNGNNADDDEETVEVIVEGDSEGIAIAKQEIFAIVSERVKNMTIRVRNVNYVLFPFLDKTAGDLTKGEDNVKLSIPDIFAPNFTTAATITLSGDREATATVKERLERLAESLSTDLITSTESFPASKHKYISAKDVFAATSVFITVPQAPNTSDDTVKFLGLPKDIKPAMNKVSEQVNSVKIDLLDISRAHGKSVPHAQALASYFKASGMLQKIADEYKVEIYIQQPDQLYAPGAQAVTIETSGPNEEAVKAARKAIVALVNKYEPSKVSRVSDIDPFFLRNLAGPKDRNLAKYKKDHGVTVLVPENPKVNGDVILIYEGTSEEDDFGPSADEIKATFAAVDSSFADIREKQAKIIGKLISVPVGEHKFVRGPDNTTLRAIVGGTEGHEPFVRVTFGDEIKDAEEPVSADSIYVRGLKDEVTRVLKEIEEAVEDGKNYAVLSQYTTEFQIPPEHVKHVVGKGGSQLAKFREYGVNIDLDESGQGVVKGIKKNADEAKVQILAFAKKIADEVNVKLPVPADHHASLIGTGGKFVKRLEEKYDVRIRFPKTGEENANEIVLRGPSKGVAKAKEEILDLVNYEIENSHSQTISVPVKSLPRIIGRGGEFINDIKDSTNTRIDVKQEKSDNTDETGNVDIEIVGTKAGVKEAAAKIQAIVSEFQDTVIEHIEVNPKFHGALIGPGGQTLKDILTKAGMTDVTPSVAARTVAVPAAGTKDNKVRVQGSKKIVAKIVKIIQDMVAERESQISEVVDVPVSKHRDLIGAGGAAKRSLEEKFKVTLQIPKQGAKNKDGELDTGVTITGKAEDVATAKAKIQELSQDKWKEEILVPRTLHTTVSDNGNLPRKLKYELKVNVDHGSVRTPRDGNPVVPAGAIGSDSEDKDSFRWSVVEDAVDHAANGTIPWRLEGSDENVAKAKAIIEAALDVALKHTQTGYLWLPDTSRYRFLVGPHGATVSHIREKSGCKIYIPKAGVADSAVTVRGSPEGLEKAKEMMLAALKK